MAKFHEQLAMLCSLAILLKWRPWAKFNVAGKEFSKRQLPCPGGGGGSGGGGGCDSSDGGSGGGPGGVPGLWSLSCKRFGRANVVMRIIFATGIKIPIQIQLHTQYELYGTPIERLAKIRHVYSWRQKIWDTCKYGESYE